MTSEDSLGMSEEDPIYATLSETLGSLSSSSDDCCLSFDNEGPRCSSATTAADDDFEFHGPPRQDPFVAACNLAMASGGLSHKESCSSSSSSVFFEASGLKDDPRLGFVNGAFEGDSSGTLSHRHRSSSLSMNDLDSLEPGGGTAHEEMMFILPVRSESMLSLYRLYLAEEECPGLGTSLHYSLEASRADGSLAALPTSPKTFGPNQEIYRKKRVPLGTSGGSRVRRQHKIQRAKYLQSRSRPIITPRSENLGARLEDEVGGSFWKSGRGDRDQGVQLAVMNKAHRQNGIITISDPSGLSVEELFSVLNRASSSNAASSRYQDSAKDHLHPGTPSAYPTTEYKKIFVSEYI